MDGVFEQQVRQRAYQIWVDLGCADGQAHDHWIAAERDIKAQSTKPKKARATVTKAKTVASKTAAPQAPVAKAAQTTKPKKRPIADASIGASA